MEKVFMDAPFAKVIETTDGGRQVYGWATLEVKDKSGEIADFSGTVEAFQKWSDETAKRTNNKSLGNVRLMHSPVAVGKTTYWEPRETTIQGDDGKDQTVKGIWVGAYIPPTKPDVIRDIDEGILSAFSIGGSYQKRWWDETAKAFRFVPELSEYSLVDNPCVPGASIEQVIQKADVPWEKEESQMEKGMNPKGSYEEFKSKLYDAINEGFCSDCGKTNCGCFRSCYYSDVCIEATYINSVVVYDYDSRKHFEIPFTYDGETVSLGESFEVALDYIPVDSMTSEEAQKASRALFLEKAIQKFNEKADPGATEAGEKLIKTVTSLKGGDFIFENGKILEKKEGEKPVMNLEQLEKAAKAAGLSVEQLQAFFKAFADTETDTSINVPVVDGDGDDDNNKEFPNKPDGDEAINIEGGISAVKDAEAEVGVKEKPAPEVPVENGETAKAAEDELQKAGKSISNKNGAHLQHAANHIDAVMKGADYTAEDHVKVEAQAGQGGTGEEAPAVDVEKVFGAIFAPIIESAVAKATESFLQKSASNKDAEELAGKVEAMAKGLASQDSLKKAMDEIEAIKTLVKEIHATPQPGGPALNGADFGAFTKGFNPANLASQDDVTLEKFVAEISDPNLKDRVGQEIAMRKHRAAFK